jgi:hypothetical protein
MGVTRVLPAKYMVVEVKLFGIYPYNSQEKAELSTLVEGRI